MASSDRRSGVRPKTEALPRGPSLITVKALLGITPYLRQYSVLYAPPCSWRFPRGAIRPLAERHGKILPEHIDFLEKIAYR